MKRKGDSHDTEKYPSNDEAQRTDSSPDPLFWDSSSDDEDEELEEMTGRFFGFFPLQCFFFFGASESLE